MFDLSFNVGQFLQLADMLHKEYIIQTVNEGDRNGRIPVELVGNKMLPIASMKPADAIINLNKSMRIYIAWADTVTDKNLWQVKCILMKLRSISDKISKTELPKRFSKIEQANVFLGYISNIY